MRTTPHATKRSLALLFAGLCLPLDSGGQTAGPGAIGDTLVFSVGTTTRDAGGRDWAYFLWQAPSPDLLNGKQFAVYRKAGEAGAVANYEPLGVATGALSEAIVSAQLQRAERVGGKTAALDDALAGLSAALGVTLTGERPHRVIQVLQAARGNAGLTSSIHTLSASVPGLALSLGVAFAAPMPPGVSTYEIREWDPVACADIAVTGRITLQAGSAVLLPAPGVPVQVPDLSDGGDRSVSLRWSTPDSLRRRALLFHGFDVWRLPWSEALGRGYGATAPSAAVLESLVASGVAKRMNTLPLFPRKLMTQAEAADFAADPDTFFLIDNNGRFDAPPGPPMADGAEFGYVAAARDILGRPGLCSLAGYGRAVRTAAPKCPTDFSATVHYDDPAAPGRQLVRLTWTPDTDPNAAPATRFEIFRGTDQADISGSGGEPAAPTLLASVQRAAGGGPMVFNDVSFNANGNTEESFYGKTQWYVLRAIHDGVAGPLKTAPCAPVLATLSDHSAPAAPTGGEIVVSCPQPVVIADLAAGFPSTADPAPDNGAFHFRVTCTRRDPGVEWAEFSVQPEFGGVVELGRVYFGGDGDTVEVEVTLTREALGYNAPQQPPPLWRCLVGSGEAHLGNLATARHRPLVEDRSVRTLVPFLCGALSPGAIDVGDPLASPLLAAPTALAGAVAPDRDGWVVAGGLAPAGEYVIAGGDGTRTIDWGVAGADGTIRFFDPALAGRTPGEAGFSYQARRFVRHSPCPDDPPHQAIAANGRLLPIRLCVPKVANALEYRFFRRVDDGPLAMFAQGRVTSSPLPICRSDDSLIAHGACLSYFVQFVGKNGATGAMHFLGCRTVCVAPPQPVLSLPRAVGDATSPRLELRWSCPPQGVDRFEVFLLPKGGGTLSPTAISQASKYLESVFVSPSPGAFPIAGAGPKPYVMRFASAFGSIQYATIREKLLTPRIGAGGLGEGPAFTLSLPVILGREYQVSLRAVGPGGACVGKSSLQYSFQWAPEPALPDRSVPWPARPLPGTVADPTGQILAASLQNTRLLKLRTDLIYPAESHRAATGVRIGTFPTSSIDYSKINAGENWSFAPGEWEYLPRGQLGDLNRQAFSRPGNARSCLPAALYRQQIANDLSPTVSGDVIQVSPLVTRISTFDDPATGRRFLTDPFIGLQRRLVFFDNSDALREAQFDMYLLDTTPVVRGAKYRYWLVCFTAGGEPDVVVKAGEVTIPES